MIRNLRTRNKLLLLPLPAMVALLVILLFAYQEQSGNQVLLESIENRSFPAAGGIRQLRHDWVDLTRLLAAASPVAEAGESERWRQRFLSRLPSLEGSRTVRPELVEQLATDFETYFALAREATTGETLVQELGGGEETPASQILAEAHQRVETGLDELARSHEQHLARTFSAR